MIVAIGIASQETVMTSFAIALGTLMRGSNPDLKLGIINNRSSSIAGNRNTIVKIARDIGADYVFFLDSDMIFPPDTLDKLISRNKDIVAGCYRKRYPPFELLGRSVSDEIEEGCLQRADRLPTGCMLIKTSVFDKLSGPNWFHEDYMPDGKVRSDDYSFCADAVAAGIEMWADLEITLKLSHISSCAVEHTTLFWPNGVKTPIGEENGEALDAKSV